MDTVNRQKYEAAFKSADQDGSGKISQDELKSVLAGLGKRHTDKEVEKMFARVDTDGSGAIDQKEFLIFMKDVDNAWVRVQKKTFTRWSNTVLSNRMMSIDSITMDLRDGVKLGPLIEVLSNKKVGKMNAKCRMRLQKLENLNKCLEFLKNDGVKLINIGSDDIETGNEKITLGLIWMLILKYQIGDGLAEGSPKWLLLEWVKKQIAPYDLGIELKNFKNGWSDGRVFSALTDSLGEPQNSTIDCTQLSDDPYDCTKHALETAEGTFEIPRIMDAQDIVENPEEHSIMTYVSFFRDWADLQKTKASAANCTASGPGVEGGDSRAGDTNFTITARNMSGAQKDQGGDAFSATVTAPNGDKSTPELTDNGDGTYSGSYPLSGPGDYLVDIALRNDPIKGSTYTAHMEAGNAGNSYAEGEGLSKGKTRRPCEFTIFSVDKDGNRVTEGGDPFKVGITGPDGKEVVADVTDNNDGTHAVKYMCDSEGDYKVGVTLFADHIKDSEFTASIKRAPNAGLSYAEGRGLTRAYDNRPAEFTVYAKDDLGNPVSGDDCQVRMESEDGGDAVPVDVVDNGDGTYGCKYAANNAGKYVIHVELDGEPVKNTPKNIRVREGADTSNLGRCTFKATIHARNKAGELKTEGGDEWEVVIKAEDGSEVPCQATDHGDGQYSVEYKLDAPTGDSEGPQEFNISMTLNEEHIPGSPFKQFM